MSGGLVSLFVLVRRAKKEALLAHFAQVSKLDCEMNFYLVRAKPGTDTELPACVRPKVLETS